jgi:diguanylate cyclase (GGDEF)-like protein/PAS domain S-box-containing protein
MAGRKNTTVALDSRHYWSLALLGVLLLVLSVGAVLWWTFNDVEQQFQREALATYQQLNQRLKDNEAVLSGLSALHHAVDDVDDDQLSLFAREMLASYPHIYAINYQVRVTREELKSFQAGMHGQGFLTFQVREYEDATQRWVPVKSRPLYYPVVFLEPLEPQQAQLLGYDVYSNANLRQAIDAAIDSGEVVASAPYDLVQGGRGYALFKPVYVGLRLPEDEAQRRAQATRIVSLLVRTDGLVTANDVMDPSMSVSLYYDNGREHLLAEMKARHAAQRHWSPITTVLAFERTVSSAGQAFRLRISKPFSPDVARLDLISGAVLLVILVISFLHMRFRYARERQHSEEELFTHQQRAEVTLRAIGDAVITTDAESNIENMNAMAERLTGWQRDKARGAAVQQVFRISSEEDEETELDPVGQCLREGRVVRLADAVVLQGPLANQAMVEVTASPMRNRQGKIVSAALVFHDISKERQMQDHIAYQASHDALTGLVDRREFERLLDEMLWSAAQEGRSHALVYMDIDQFKVINDTCGHLGGDELLVQLSAMLLATVRGDDVLARLGGDEFAILLQDCPLEQAVHKADSLRRAMEDFRFVWQGKTFDVGFGIGVVALVENSGTTIDVLRAADAACYAAKAKGRRQIVVYDAEDPALQKRRGEMRWVTRIGDALRDQRFQLYYQTIAPVSSAEPNVFHCELLMRKEDEQQELVSPEEFIPTAERYNLMTDIDRWVVSTALPLIAELDAQAGPGQSNVCGINLSGQSLSDESFHDYVKGLLEMHGVNPASICFEITETSAILNFDLALKFMQEMKALGCAFALDDFGTGVSSYSYLKELPLDYVKIDGSFIRGMRSDAVDYAMVESVIRIAKVLGIKTIAEFVEDEATLALLRELGVDYAQGYGIARPAPLDEKVSDAGRA